MLPKRMNQVIQAIAAVGLTIGTAVITLATITTLNVTTLSATTAFAASTLGSPTISATTTQVSGTANAGTASSTNLVLGQGTSMDGHWHTSATINPDSLGNGAGTTTSITVTGASMSDTVILTSSSTWLTSDVAAVRVAGYVSAANTVIVSYLNTSSTAVNLPSGVLQVDVWSH